MRPRHREALRRHREALVRFEISFSQGAAWKALMRRYIGIMPVSGERGPAEHVQRAAAENGGEQGHDGEGRRGRQRQALGRAGGPGVAGPPSLFMQIIAAAVHS